MTVIYVLKCTKDKYYVGKTNDIKSRLELHSIGKGSVWTSRYKPIEVIKIIEDCDDYDEDKYTLIYMNKYGIDNVRGGSFSSLVLSKEEQLVLTKMINSSKDVCFNCGDGDHYIMECKLGNINNTLKVIYQKIIRLCESIDKDNTSR
jgi:hypothetical protein